MHHHDGRHDEHHAEQPVYEHARQNLALYFAIDHQASTSVLHDTPPKVTAVLAAGGSGIDSL